MKKYIFFVLLFSCFWAKAQDKQPKVSLTIKAGLIFTRFESALALGRRNESANEWDMELCVAENKSGFGFIVRYIAAPGFIPNPIFSYKPYPGIDRNTVKVGDLIFTVHKYENFSFLLNKKLFLFNNRHKIDLASGVQLRKGELDYFAYIYGGFDLHVTIENLDKYGLLSRVGYSYLINKHFSVSANVEYSRFKKKPADFWDFNILAGFRF